MRCQIIFRIQIPSSSIFVWSQIAFRSAYSTLWLVTSSWRPPMWLHTYAGLEDNRPWAANPLLAMGSIVTIAPMNYASREEKSRSSHTAPPLTLQTIRITTVEQVQPVLICSNVQLQWHTTILHRNTCPLRSSSALIHPSAVAPSLESGPITSYQSTSFDSHDMSDWQWPKPQQQKYECQKWCRFCKEKSPQICVEVAFLLFQCTKSYSMVRK